MEIGENLAALLGLVAMLGFAGFIIWIASKV